MSDKNNNKGEEIDPNDMAEAWADNGPDGEADPFQDEAADEGNEPREEDESDEAEAEEAEEADEAEAAGPEEAPAVEERPPEDFEQKFRASQGRLDAAGRKISDLEARLRQAEAKLQSKPEESPPQPSETDEEQEARYQALTSYLDEDGMQELDEYISRRLQALEEKVPKAIDEKLAPVMPVYNEIASDRFTAAVRDKYPAIDDVLKDMSSVDAWLETLPPGIARQYGAVIDGQSDPETLVEDTVFVLNQYRPIDKAEPNHEPGKPASRAPVRVRSRKSAPPRGGPDPNDMDEAWR